MKEYNMRAVELALKELGHKHFKMGSYNLNLIAIRANTSKSDKFDDLFILDFYDEYGQRKTYYLPCTTDPGKHWLNNPMRSDGCIITCPGQYRSAFQMGLHKGYTALRQIRKMEYVRDNNKDNILDFDLMDNPRRRFWDICYTNIHRASKNWVLKLVGKYSAGCTVIQSVEQFENILIHYCKKQIEAGKGDKYTYTLIEEKVVQQYT